MKIIYLALFLFTCGLNASIIERCNLSTEDGCDSFLYKAGKNFAEYQELVFPYNESSGQRGNYGYRDANSSILGGFVGDAHQDEFPHMAHIGYGPLNYILWLCSGTLISDKFILTTRYCLDRRNDSPASYIALGVLKTSMISSQHIHKVKRVIEYPFSGIVSYHDIGLIELAEPVSLDHTKVPACLHLGEPVEVALVTGWGMTSDLRKRVPDVLQKVILSKFTNEECAATYTPNRLMRNGFDAESEMCYGLRKEGMDPCKGFTGGPLQVKNKDDVSCMNTVVGISSLSRTCGVVDVPTLYTRVAYYVEWIQDIVSITRNQN